MKDDIKKHNSKRVAKNTLYLYFRTILCMGITIYTSRVVLDVLGIEDYGIYSVVGGFVAMFSMLSGTLTAASQRYIAFEIGKANSDIKKIFSITITIHLFLAAVIFILLESFGLWFLNYKMNLSPDRIIAANWVFQCSVITFCVSLISIPYTAAIIAYERMSVFAYISIFEVVCKLLAVYALIFIPIDSLILYAVFMLILSLILRSIYNIYCNRKIKECRFRFCFDKEKFQEILGFCGWNFIGSSATILNNQGINMLMNLFFGVALNAAKGISSQVENAINTFVQNFMMALNPQITKSYSSGDYVYVNKMIVSGTKLAFFLFWVICLPVFINIDYILSVWLKKVPESTAIFIRLGLVFNLCQCLSQCLYTAMLATGKIKKYQIIVGGLSFMAFPTTWFFFYIGLPGYWGYCAMIVFSLACLIARLFLLQEMIEGFKGSVFLKQVVLPIVFSIAPLILCFSVIHSKIATITFDTFIFESILSVILSSVVIGYVGLNAEERSRIETMVVSKIKKK